MSGERGIKTFCIASIVTNGLFFFIVLKTWLAGNVSTDGSHILIPILLLTGNLTSVMYAGQILVIRKRYYQGQALISSTEKTRLRISLIVQILFTFLIGLALIAGMILLLFLIVVFNILTAAKGAYLMRIVRKNYVEDLMDSFD